MTCMTTRSFLICSLRHTRNAAFTPIVRARYRGLVSSNAPPESSTSNTHKQQSWLTRKINSSPRAKRIFVKFAYAMGYGSPRQVAGRRAFNMYLDLCIGRADQERVFWTTGELQFILILLSLLACFFYDEYCEVVCESQATGLLHL